MNGGSARNRLVVAVLALLAVACFAPPQAAAVPKVKVVSLKLPDSNGFHVSFVSISSRGGGLQVSLRSTEVALFAVEGRGSSVSYVLNGTDALEKGRIEADFGPFGAIDGRLRLGKRLPAGDCDPIVYRKVRFAGTVQLQAENGIATANARSAMGKQQSTTSHSGCDFRRAPKPTGDPHYLLSCNDNVVYEADHDGADVNVNHYAEATEQQGEVQINRSIFTSGRKSTFTADAKLHSAHVSPGPPFSGSATYRDGELTGDLSATFLGAPAPIALTPAKATLTPSFATSPPRECAGAIQGLGRPAAALSRFDP